MTTKKHDDDRSKVLGVRISDRELMHFHAALVHQGHGVSTKSQIVKTILLNWYRDGGFDKLNLPITQVTLDVVKPNSSNLHQLGRDLKEKDIISATWLELVPSRDRGKCKMIYQGTMDEKTDNDIGDGINMVKLSLFVNDHYTDDDDRERAMEVSRIMKILIHIGAYKGTKYEDYINTLSADEISIEGMNITKESEIPEDIIPQDIRDNSNDGIPEGMIIAVDDSE